MSVDTTTLRWFQLVADGERVTDVAHEFRVSQPGLSRALARLEDEVGVELLHKQGRVLRMTQAGSVFKRHVDEVLHRLDDALAALDALADPDTGHVVLGFQLSLGTWLVPTLLRQFAETYPGVTFTLRHVDDASQSMAATGVADLELTARRPDDPAVSRLTLVTTGNDAVIQQISNQLLKLVDVVDVEDVTREEHFERELLLVKVKAKATQVGKLWSATLRAGGRVLWEPADSFTIELTSNEAGLNRFIAEIANFGEVLEVVRSGALAIQKGKEVLES